MSDLKEQFDQAMTDLLPQLRVTKIINQGALLRIFEAVDGFAALMSNDEVVPRALVGELWWVFTAMLTEANYAASPEPILEAAWMYEERLEKIFGPNFG